MSHRLRRFPLPPSYDSGTSPETGEGFEVRHWRSPVLAQPQFAPALPPYHTVSPHGAPYFFTVAA
jgi:hypothetical protein